MSESDAVHMSRFLCDSGVVLERMSGCWCIKWGHTTYRYLYISLKNFSKPLYGALKVSKEAS